AGDAELHFAGGDVAGVVGGDRRGQHRVVTDDLCFGDGGGGVALHVDGVEGRLGVVARAAAHPAQHDVHRTGGVDEEAVDGSGTTLDRDVRGGQQADAGTGHPHLGVAGQAGP